MLAVLWQQVSLADKLQIYVALLKFDFFFFLGFTVQFVVIVTQRTDAEFALTIAAIPVTIVILMLAAYWTRCESKLGMCFIIVRPLNATLSMKVLGLTLDTNLDSLLRCTGLLLVQASPHVSTVSRSNLSSCPTVPYDLRSTHNPVDHLHNHQRLHVHGQLRQGAEAAYPTKEEGERGREVTNDRNAKYASSE